MLWASLAIIVRVRRRSRCACRTRPSSSGSRPCSTGCSRAVLAGAVLLFRRNLIRACCPSRCSCPSRVWARLNWSWVGFFAFMGRRTSTSPSTSPTDLWVNFKLFGGMGLMLAVRRGAGAVPRQAHRGEAVSAWRRPSASASRRSSRSTLELVDESAQHAGHAGARPGGGTHWRLAIVSPRFAGQPTVARHRMVYQALGELMQRSHPRARDHARAARKKRKESNEIPPARPRHPRRARAGARAGRKQAGAAERRAGRPSPRPRRRPSRPRGGPVATVNGVAVPRSRLDAMVRSSRAAAARTTSRCAR